MSASAGARWQLSAAGLPEAWMGGSEGRGDGAPERVGAVDHDVAGGGLVDRKTGLAGWPPGRRGHRPERQTQDRSVPVPGSEDMIRRARFRERFRGVVRGAQAQGARAEAGGFRAHPL